MFVGDDDDLINVIIAPITQRSTIHSGYSEVEKYTDLMLPHSIRPGVCCAGYEILNSEIVGAYQESAHHTARQMMTQLCCLRSWWNLLNLVGLLD